ncbi:hypothetical protein WDW86_11605 [Bdellovibrionota bacterium FG-2]
MNIFKAISLGVLGALFSVAMVGSALTSCSGTPTPASSDAPSTSPSDSPSASPSPSPLAQGWSTLGTTDVTGFDTYSALIAFDSKGAPYVAYAESATQKKYVIKWDGSAWNKLGDAIGSVTNFNTFAFGIDLSSDTPYLAASHSTPEIFKFDGTNWVTVGTAPPTNSISSLAFMAGVPYLATRCVCDECH